MLQICVHSANIERLEVFSTALAFSELWLQSSPSQDVFELLDSGWLGFADIHKLTFWEHKIKRIIPGSRSLVPPLEQSCKDMQSNDENVYGMLGRHKLAFTPFLLMSRQIMSIAREINHRIFWKPSTLKNGFLLLGEQNDIPKIHQSLSPALLCEDGLHIPLHADLAGQLQDRAQSTHGLALWNGDNHVFWHSISKHYQVSLQQLLQMQFWC